MRDLESDLVVCPLEGCSFQLEFSRRLLEEIRHVVWDEFRHRGVEIGGVLFGSYRDGVLRPISWRAITCSHAQGPAFVLSNPEKQRLAELLEAAATDPILQVLEPLGWFVAHRGRQAELTAEDCELFDAFFPQPWQLTLVLALDWQSPTRGGIFFRTEQGSGSPRRLCELVLKEASGAARADPPAARSAPAGAVLNLQPALEQAHNSGRRWGVVAFLTAAAALAFLAWPGRETPPAVETIGLRLLDASGPLRIEWDHSKAAAAGAEEGLLWIDDGGPLPPIRLDRDALQKGHLLYDRISQDVKVRLTLRRRDKPPVEQIGRFVGSPVPKTDSQQLLQTRRAIESAREKKARLQLELEEETKKAAALKAKLDGLERRQTRTSRR